jgi:hypothetical protein
MFPDKAQEEEPRGAPRSEERGAGSGPSRTSAHRTRRVSMEHPFQELRTCSKRLRTKHLR